MLRSTAVPRAASRNICSTHPWIHRQKCSYPEACGQSIIFTSFPLELFKPTEVYDPVAKQDVFIWDANFDALRGYVSDFQAGAWPSSSPAGTPEP